MSYNSCPNCGRKATKSLSSNFFSINTCKKCGKKFCSSCGNDSGRRCPGCNSTNHAFHGKVYA